MYRVIFKVHNFSELYEFSFNHINFILKKYVPRARACAIQLLMLCMGVASNSGFAKIYFIKFLISLIRKNKMKYKFPGIWYTVHDRVTACVNRVIVC